MSAEADPSPKAKLVSLTQDDIDLMRAENEGMIPDTSHMDSDLAKALEDDQIESSTPG